MATTEIVLASDLRIDPALTPAFYAACGALPVRRAWYEVEDDAVQCCLTMALAAAYGGLEKACEASACGIGAYCMDIDRFRVLTGLPLSTPYVVGLIDGWDGYLGDTPSSALTRAARDYGLDTEGPRTRQAFLSGFRDGKAAREDLDRLEAPPGYPLASASDLRIEATDDDEEDDIDEDDEKFDDDDDDDEDEDEDDWEDEE